MKIDEFIDILKREYPSDQYEKMLRELADNNIYVCSERKAYAFDRIKDLLCKTQKISSADALLLYRKGICLIEFKTGFAQEIDSELYECKKEEQKKSIRLKAYESLALVEKVICHGESIDFKKNYLAVIDASENALSAIIEINGELSNHDNADVGEKAKLQHDLICNTLLVYGKEIGGKHIFYDTVVALYDYEFDSYITKNFKESELGVW